MEEKLVSPAAMRLRKTLGSANAELWEILGVGTGGAGTPAAQLLSGGQPAILHSDLPPHRHEWNLLIRSERNLRMAFFAQPLDPYASWSLQSLTCTPLLPRKGGQTPQEAQLLGRFVAGRLEFDVAPTHTSERDTPPLLYNIHVTFDSPTPGDYAQVLVCDFGEGHLLGLPLSVGVESTGEEEELDWANQPAKEDPTFGSSSSRLIIDNSSSEDLSRHSHYFLDAPPFTHHPLPQVYASDIDKHLGESGLCEASTKPAGLNLGESWSSENYVPRLLHLLDLEQTSRAAILSSNMALSRMQLGKMFPLETVDGGEVRLAGSGELLGQISLEGVLSEDTFGGRLLTQQCDSVDVELVWAPAGVKGLTTDERRHRWECPLEAKTRDSVFFRLTKEMVAAHHLITAMESQTNERMEVQAKVAFRLQTLAFAEWRFAVNRLPSLNLVFPILSDGGSPAPELKSEVCGTDVCEKLNAQQRSVVAEVLREDSKEWREPLLLVGPWGTGKTLTLAWLIRVLLATQPEAKVLLCTQSNSAADLYIHNYFHSWSKDKLMPKPLRIYYTGRKLETIAAEAREYATLGVDGRLRWPTAEEISAARIVLTTLSTAKHLMDGGKDAKREIFTHILLDEAAQAMEPATLVPLSLAGPRSQVILAGDPRQSGPACYSQVAKRHGLNQSLLERLWSAYPKAHPRRVQLTANYRSTPGLVDYLGKYFYQEKLMACSELPSHPKLPPLALFPVRGVDRHDATSGGYHNLAEVRRVVALVAEMGSLHWWPRETWGPYKPSSIGVLCPYQDQVIRIRQALRNHSDASLRQVNVEHINNVQGKEYRVVIISTVRTLGTCDGASPQGLEGGGFLSDPRLLNTALTRAETLLAVVGDPVSLATLGYAKNLWRQILEDWGPQSPQSDLWPTLQKHIKFVESSLRSKDSVSQRLFLNPFSSQFTPAAPASSDQSSLLRVLVQRENASLAEVWVPASVLQPFLNSWPEQRLGRPNGLTSGAGVADLSASNLIPPQNIPPQFWQLPFPPPFTNLSHPPPSLSLPPPSVGEMNGHSPIQPPMIMPWHFPPGTIPPFPPIPIPFPLHHPFPHLGLNIFPPGAEAALSPNSGHPSHAPPSLLDSSFPCPLSLVGSSRSVVTTSVARRTSPSSSASPSNLNETSPPLNDSENFPPLASTSPTLHPFQKTILPSVEKPRPI